ncbi:MAG: TetR/AcrR family transcriptional regulator [Pseudomonadales bacterium]
MFDSDTTRDAILRAALTRFASYGYKRTSLNDIAGEAGLSRPTLYSYFKNKEAILRAVSQGLHDSTLANVEVALTSNADIHNRLMDGFWAWSEPFMRVLFGSLHGAELISASSAMASDISEDARSRFQALLVKHLKKARRDGLIDLNAIQLNNEQAAEFLILSLNGLSSGDVDERTYKQRLATLVRLFLSSVSASGKQR